MKYYWGVPDVVIPETWATPPYEQLSPGFVEKDGMQCMSKEDAKRVVKNQAICDEARKSAIDLLWILGLEHRQEAPELPVEFERHTANR